MSSEGSTAHSEAWYYHFLPFGIRCSVVCLSLRYRPLLFYFGSPVRCLRALYVRSIAVSMFFTATLLSTVRCATFRCFCVCTSCASVSHSRTSLVRRFFLRRVCPTFIQRAMPCRNLRFDFVCAKYSMYGNMRLDENGESTTLGLGYIHVIMAYTPLLPRVISPTISVCNVVWERVCVCKRVAGVYPRFCGTNIIIIYWFYILQSYVIIQSRQLPHPQHHPPV